MKIKYTFDDVLIQPKKSSVIPAKVNLKTKLTKKISLSIPLISATMDTVTESKMAISMAREGGIGVIHRNMSIEEQCKQVEIVKRSESGVIDKPVVISAEKSMKELNELRNKYNISGVPVVDKNNVLLGIITHRDTLFVSNQNEKVKNIMTKMPLVTIKTTDNKKKANELLKKYKVEKIPIVSSANKLVGLITAKDFIKTQKFPNASKDKKGRLLVGGATGFYGNAFDRAKELVKCGTDVIVIDTAHAHTSAMLEIIKKVKKLNVEVIAGNVGTSDAVKDLVKAGADAIKVGIGPGSICTTRIIAGVGVPQVSAISDVYTVAKKYKIPIIADGGIRYSGDISKAIVAGADAIMAGSQFAGCLESPGQIIFVNGKQYKRYRGMGSTSVLLNKDSKSKDRYFHLTDDMPVAEGIDAGIPYKGTVHEVIHQLVGGIKQTMFYVGASNIAELKKNGTFIQTTSAGLKESHPHDISLMQEAPNYSKKK